MADQGFEQDFLRDFLEEAAAVSPLANNEKTFRSVFGAFRKGDAKAFQAALKAARLLPRCHLICRWLRVKESILLCLEPRGPPKEITRPNPRKFAEAIVRITSDEKPCAASRRRSRSRTAPRTSAIKAHRLGPYCHVLCHWLCLVRYRLVCRWVCHLDLREKPDYVARAPDRRRGDRRAAREEARVRPGRLRVQRRRRREALGRPPRRGTRPPLPVHLRVVLQLALRARVLPALPAVPAGEDPRPVARGVRVRPRRAGSRSSIRPSCGSSASPSERATRRDSRRSSAS